MFYSGQCIPASYTSTNHKQCIFIIYSSLAGKEPNNFQEVLKLIELKSIFTT